MASKVPEKIFVSTLIEEIQKHAGDWSTKKSDDGKTDVLDTTEHNTAIVIHALREAAVKSGYISMMFALISCKTEELQPEVK